MSKAYLNFKVLLKFAAKSTNKKYLVLGKVIFGAFLSMGRFEYRKYVPNMHDGRVLELEYA